MKKSILALIIASGFISSAAMADPTIIPLVFTCPAVTGTGPFVLNNFGGKRIAGYGTETINGKPSFNSPYFTYNIPAGANIPSCLNTYASSATSYNNATGVVSCVYTSSGKFDPITVSYAITNADGTQLAAQTSSTITLNQFIGIA